MIDRRNTREHVREGSFGWRLILKVDLSSHVRDDFVYGTSPQ